MICRINFQRAAHPVCAEAASVPVTSVRYAGHHDRLPTRHIRMCLINAGPVVNKTGLLNDFFLRHADFLFITETWPTPGDLSPFELANIKAKQHKLKSEPWLSDDTRALCQVCRMSERRWKKTSFKSRMKYKGTI